jgi:hypothetical protein
MYDKKKRKACQNKPLCFPSVKCGAELEERLVNSLISILPARVEIERARL